jgi:hypothetical protein
MFGAELLTEPLHWCQWKVRTYGKPFIKGGSWWGNSATVAVS